MASKKQRKELGSEHLMRIIDLCESVEERGLDPFLVEVDDVLAVVREYFPDWELPEELCLDAEAVHKLASVIKLQSDWIKRRSTSLYTDPFLLEEKIRKLGGEKLGTMFLRCWHPIVELEQISSHSLAEAIKYWQELLPLRERWLDFPTQERAIGATTREELIGQRILVGKAFSEDLHVLWEELKHRVDEEGKIRYWEFVEADTYAETIKRAFITSFLVTYGYANLEVHRLEEEMYLKPFDEPVPFLEKRQVTSLPVSISFDEWKKLREANQG